MFKILKGLNKKEIFCILLGVLLTGVQAYCELSIPDYMSEITKLVQTPGSEMSEILKNGGIMLLFALASLILMFAVGFLAAFAGTSFEKHLRKRVFLKVQSFGLEEIKSFSTSSLITRATNDITQVKQLILVGVQMMARAPIMATIAISKILGKEWEFSLITAAGVATVIVLDIVLIVLALPRFKKIQGMIDNVNNITRENLTGIRVVRAYNAEEYQLKKFQNANSELAGTMMFVEKIMALLGPTMSATMQGMSLAIYLVGATLITKASFENMLTIFSDMVVFSSYAVQIVMSFMMLAMIFIILPRAIVSGRRISEVLEKDTKIRYGEKSENNSDVHGRVVFRNVSFKYPDAEDYVLKDISFSAEPGETVAIIGSTGCGKSTLVNLIPRFYDATEGEIFIDNLNVKDYSEIFLNDKLGYVSQKAMLFKGTVKSNVKLGKKEGKKVKNKSLSKGLKIAKAEDFVMKMDDGVDAKIAQGGSNVSGGQKQRLSIARAIAREAEIYIFDDTFSALDFKTDAELRAGLNKELKDSTKFIVAQRIGTIKNADKIIVLEDGKMVGLGKHEELLKKCKVYREIAESQLSREELEHAWK